MCGEEKHTQCTDTHTHTQSTRFSMSFQQLLRSPSESIQRIGRPNPLGKVTIQECVWSVSLIDAIISVHSLLPLALPVLPFAILETTSPPQTPSLKTISCLIFSSPHSHFLLSCSSSLYSLCFPL